MSIDPIKLAAVVPSKAASSSSRPGEVAHKTEPVPAPTDRITLSDAATQSPGRSPPTALTPADGSAAPDLPTVNDLRAAFMATPGSERWNKHLDLNQDGIVNFGDLAALRERMGAPKPGPAATLDDVRGAFMSSVGEKGFSAAADLNGDGQVNFADLAALRQSMAPAPEKPAVSLADIRQSFMATEGGDRWNAAADLDGDGRVNFADLALLRARMTDEG